MKTELKKYKLKDLLKIKNGQDHKGLHDGCYPVYGSGCYCHERDLYQTFNTAILHFGLLTHYTIRR